jgi:hypothetical protein
MMLLVRASEMAHAVRKNSTGIRQQGYANEGKLGKSNLVVLARPQMVVLSQKTKDELLYKDLFSVSTACKSIFIGGQNAD